MYALRSSGSTADQDSDMRRIDLHPFSHSEEQRNVLQLRLQQRRTREQLADQGIMPPLKSPAAFHEQRKSLERSKTGDYLKHKIRTRPEKSELVNMRILQEPTCDGPVSDSHTKLKRARLSDSLNEKIAARPGALELVQKNILPITDPTRTVDDGKDSYAFEEDSSSESLSPDHSEENKSGGSRSPTPNDNDTHGCQSTDSQNQEENMTNSQEAPQIPVPAIIKQSKMSEKNRHKKPKDVKPKVKKLKYHQYIPPDQKAERSPPPQMDSAYARLLQQQQLFLQLQILSQQKQQTQMQTPAQTQQSFSFQTLSQHTHKQSSDPQSSCPSGVPTGSSSSSSPVKNGYCNSSISPIRLGPLPANLDDLKVSELRQQLRIRGLPVSGTKTALIERLRPFRDSSCASPSGSGDASTTTFPVTPTGSLSSYQSPHGTGFYPFCSSGSTPPISPASSDLSVNGSLPDSFSDVTMSSPQFGLQPSPAQLNAEDGQSASTGPGLDTEKDKMLVEKQKVIEELTWKLHQEQRQVEELRMQLHKRKRLQDCPAPHSQHMMHLQPPAQMQQFYGVSVKQEQVSSSCPLSSKPSCMSRCEPHCLELPSSVSPAGLSAFLSPQCSPQDSPATKPSSSPQPPSPAQPFLMRDGCSHTNRAPRSMQIQQKSAGQTVSCPYPPEQRNIQPLYSSPADNVIHRGSSKAKSASIQPKEALSVSLRHVDPESPASSVFCSSGCPASVSKRPPCYEDAVKQMVRSQQMDELLDVLIESGVSPSGGRFHRHMSPAMLPYDPTAAHGDVHLEALLSPMSRTQPDAQAEGFHDKLMMDTPVSPTVGKISAVATETHGLGMTFPESPWETMEWLDLTPPSSATAFHNSLPPAGPSIFNTEFLDVGDISLNSAMDLHLDHW